MKIRIISFIISLTCIVALLTGCAKEERQPPSLDEKMEERVFLFEWESEPCDENVSLSKEDAEALLSIIDSIDNEYPYAHLYETDKALERLTFDASVEQHEFSALDKSGKLTTESLFATVQKNNETFLESKPFGYENVDEDYLTDLCELIIEAVNDILEKEPDIDRERVLCNLGNLKILYDKGMLDFAQVTDKWVLAVNNLTASMAQTLKGEGAYRNTIMHETMHLIQIGCACEDIGKDAGRRCGICVYWDDWAMNSADWDWFFEASAERNASTLANTDPMTYTYWVDYLCSFNTSVILDVDNDADRIETVCFYSDPEILFSAFDITDEEDKKELINAIISINVLQTSPEAFYDAYEKEYGVRPDDTEESHELFRYSLKPAVAVTLAKAYYKNIINLICEKEIPLRDLAFLVNFFESQINQHLSYEKEITAKVNGHFFSRYLTLREALFTALEKYSGEGTVSGYYNSYDMCAVGKMKLNASLSFLPEEKKNFFLERCQWHYDHSGIGVKVEKNS